MFTELKAFMEEITLKTGLEISVFDENGVFVTGDSALSQVVAPKVESTVASETLGVTFFKMKFRSQHFIGAIKGVGKTEKNYAFLVSELAEKNYSKNTSLTREEFFTSVIFGEASFFQISKYAHKYAIEDKSACVMIVTGESGKAKDVLEIILNYCSDSSDFATAIDESQCVLIKFTDGSDGEYQSETEFAEFLSQSVYEETGIKVSVAIGSSVKNVADLSTSYSQATTVKRMSKNLSSKDGVHSFKEYILVKMLEDLPKYKLSEYLELLMDEKAKEIFSDEEMTATAEQFLEENLNVSETSRKIYLHRNTLMYRLDKIEKSTGLNIRKFSDAVTFRLITMLTKLLR